MEKFLGLHALFNFEFYLRAIIVSLYAIFLFRVVSSRLYGNHSSLDFIIYITVGAIFAETIVNNIPLLPSMLASALIVILHRFLAYLCYKSHLVGKFIKGDKVKLVKNGEYIEKNLKSCQISKHDILQTLRIDHSLSEIGLVKQAILERSGQISFLFTNKN